MSLLRDSLVTLGSFKETKENFRGAMKKTTGKKSKNQGDVWQDKKRSMEWFGILWNMKGDKYERTADNTLKSCLDIASHLRNE